MNCFRLWMIGWCMITKLIQQPAAINPSLPPCSDTRDRKENLHQHNPDSDDTSVKLWHLPCWIIIVIFHRIHTFCEGFLFPRSGFDPGVVTISAREEEAFTEQFQHENTTLTAGTFQVICCYLNYNKTYLDINGTICKYSIFIKH